MQTPKRIFPPQGSLFRRPRLRGAVELSGIDMTEAFSTVHETPPRLRAGDVFKQSDGQFIVIRVTDCNAVCAPITKSYKKFTPRFGEEEVTVAVRQSNIRISSNAEMDILERRGTKGVEEFLKPKQKEHFMTLNLGDVLGYSVKADAAEASGTCGRFTVVAVDETCARIASNNCGAVGKEAALTVLIIERDLNEFYLIVKKPTDEERAAELKTFLDANAEASAELTKNIGEEEKTMALKKSLKNPKGTVKPIANPRGGLAAEAMAAKKITKPVSKSNSVRPKLFDFSISSVLHRLSSEGVTVEQAQIILKKKGIEATLSSIRTSITDGKNPKYAHPASLTREQISELKALAKE